MNFKIFYPVKPASITQYFGANPAMYADPKYGGIRGHNGVDFRALHGQPIYATHPGICYPEIDDHGGNGVVIRSDQSYDYNGQQVYFKTIYWHLTDSNAVVKTGQHVKAGDLIGYADNTGASTGDHLHFGLKPQAWNESDWTWYNTEQTNGFLGAIDPQPFWNGYCAEDAQKVIMIMQKLIDLIRLEINLLK